MADPRPPRRLLGADDVTEVRWLSGVAVSPAGDRVCVIETLVEPGTGETVARALLVDVPSGRTSLAPVPELAPYRACWDPEGRWLAVVAGPAGARVPWIWDTATDSVRPLGGDLPEGTEVVGPLDWSPDGRRVAYPVGSAAGAEPWRPMRERPAQLIDGDVFKSDGLPTGSTPGFSWLRVSPVDGGPGVDLTGPDGRDVSCAWSPDGQQVAFLSDRHGPAGSGVPPALWVVSADGGRPRRLTEGAGLVEALSWSPTGHAIAYIGNDDAADHGVNREVRVVDLASGECRRLSTGLDVSVGVCVQSDDVRGYGDAVLRWPRLASSGILCTFPRGGTVRLAWCSTESGEAVRPAMTPVVQGQRVVVSFDATADAAVIAYVATDPSTPGELYVIGPTSAGERRLTARNDEWLGRVDLAAMEAISVSSADGTAVEAFVWTPPEGAGTAPYPLVLTVHGGPHWPCGWRFSFEHQRLAAQGYLVVMANPRGSQGYGEAFSTVIQADWDHLDHEDVVAVLDQVAATDRVDAARMAVTGVSYGGFLAGRLIGRTTRFRAAVVENAVLDLVSYFGGTADGGRFAMAELGGAPWDNPTFYRSRSPLELAPSITTPLLLIHGELDQNCPIGQSEQMFASLRRLGRDVQLLRIPGEGHGMVLEGTLAHRLQRWEVFDRFLQQHLGSRSPGTTIERGNP